MIFEPLNFLKLGFYGLYTYFLFISRVYLWYNTSDQILYGIIQGIIFTLVAYYFLIGPNPSTIFGSFFGEVAADDNENLSEESILMLRGLCKKLGVPDNLDPE